MDADTADQVIAVTDELERVLRPVQEFLVDKLIKKAGADLAGAAVDLPQKVAGIGPIVLRYLGQEPGDEPYDFLLDLQQGLDTNPIPSPMGPAHHNRVVYETDPGPDGPHAPRADAAVDAQFDP